MIKFKLKGSFSNTEKFLSKAQKLNLQKVLENYGKKGVTALSLATPVDTGLTASSWRFEVKTTSRGCSITWINDNAENGVPVAILIQYGHATPGGTYVQGVDFINPVMKPIFNEIAENLWKEVSKL